MSKTTAGRQPLQIVELRQPLCANVFGTAPCTATGDKCYNTRGTCKDPDNFRFVPEDPLAADRTYAQGDTLTASDFNTGTDFFFALSANIPTSPTGCLMELGSTAVCLYLGFTGSNIVFRAGSGGDPAPATCARVAVAHSAIAGQYGTLYGAVDISADTVRLWWWNPRLRTLTLLGEATAAAPFAAWAGAQDGGVGTVVSGVTAGEGAGDFNGTITELKVYDSTYPYDMGADFVLPLYFSDGRIGARSGDLGLPYIIPSLGSVSTSPAEINLAGSDPDAQGIGIRATCNLTFRDHPHTDRLVDPYLSSRSFDPSTRGSFWTKWIRRNPHWSNILIRLYEGYVGEALDDMVQRQYFLENIPSVSDGKCSLTGKDVLARVQARKAQAPVASPGTLYGDITDVALSFDVDGATVSDYPASGTLRIDDELMTYSAVTASTNGITFTITERGTDGSVAADHSDEAPVQTCLRYTLAAVDEICADLLVNYAGVDAGYIPTEEWRTEIGNYLPSYQLTTIITEPASVQELLSELQEQAQFYLWWDERARVIRIKAIRGVDSDPPTLSVEGNILQGVQINHLPRQRISQAWVYYGVRDWTQSLSDPKNFLYQVVTADLGSEEPEQYGQKSVRKIYSRWLPSAALANTTASKLVNRYSQVPREIRFSVDAKDRDYWVGDQIKISHYLDVDEYGERQLQRWTITSAEESVPGHTVTYIAEDTTLYGNIYYIMPSGAADYSAPAAFGASYIGDADGLLSDGTSAARIN